MTTKEMFINHLTKKYPSLSQENLSELISDQLFSPFTLELPKALAQQIQKVVSAFFELRQNKKYQEYVLSQNSELQGYRPGNFALSNSLDFHISENNELKLIEVNTNAAFLALGLELYETLQIKNPTLEIKPNLIRDVIQEEASLAGLHQRPMKVAIVDENPKAQRLYVEFLLYNEIFKHHGFESQIFDIQDPKLAEAHFIYNRHTDFFLSKPESAILKKSYFDGKHGVSPNPFEYALLADKTRFIDWSNLERFSQLADISKNSADTLSKIIPKTFLPTDVSKEDLWNLRKNLFFKPRQSFGSKQTYKGQAISRKVFDEIYSTDFIAQELVTPKEEVFHYDSQDVKMKYDLRCYFYKDHFQLAIARFYQGQVTNLRTPLGGFAAVKFV